jgi:hypothetical protein
MPHMLMAAAAPAEAAGHAIVCTCTVALIHAHMQSALSVQQLPNSLPFSTPSGPAFPAQQSPDISSILFPVALGSRHLLVLA